MLAGLIFCVLPGFPCAIYHSHVGESDRLQSKESQSYKSHYNTPNSVPHKEGTLRECGTFIDAKLLRISNVLVSMTYSNFCRRSKLKTKKVLLSQYCRKSMRKILLKSRGTEEFAIFFTAGFQKTCSFFSIQILDWQSNS